MALNLWKTGGKPTSYNPLPTGLVNMISVELKDYILVLKAKSATNAQLKITTANGSLGISDTRTLTSEFQQYTYTFTNKATQNLYIQDLSSTGNIIITDIQLVQAPLPRLTINGIDGFQSGKWSFSNATVIDDETLQVNVLSNGNTYTSDLYVNVLPNTTYTLKVEDVGGDGGALIRKADGSVTYVAGYDVDGSSKTFTTDNTTTQIYLRLFNRTSVAGEKHIIKRPQLNLGTIPSPYSKKTGDKMVLPTAKDNLFNKVVHTLNDTSYGTQYNVKPNTNYVLSHTVNVRQFDSAGNAISTLSTNSFTTLSNAVKVAFRNDHVFAILDVFQFVEGNTLLTPYKPYAVQVNKKPLRYVPKKNLLSDTWKQGNTSGGNLTVRLSNDFLEVQQKLYTFSLSGGYSFWLDYYDQNKTLVSSIPSYQTGAYTFTPVSNVKYLKATIKRVDEGNILVSDIPFIKPQLEEGTQSTAYEPYTPILPRAKTGTPTAGVKQGRRTLYAKR